MEEHYIDPRNTKHVYELALTRLKEDPNMSQRNKDIIQSFFRDSTLGKTVLGRAKKKISPGTLLSRIPHFYSLIRFLNKDLDKVTQEDMESYIEALESDVIRSRSRLLNGKILAASDLPLSSSYKRDIKITIKKFYKWLWGSSKEIPKIVEWIDTYDQPKEVPALTEAEIQCLLDRAKTPRHRALIQVLFDGGFRLSELLNIRLLHVRLISFDPNDNSKKCFILRVPYSKTLPRTVALPMKATTKWLNMWLEDHPAKPIISPDGTIDAKDLMVQLFPMTDMAVRLVVKRIGKLALGKRVYPHLLRHSSATYWSNKLPYFKLCKRFGWTMTSNMPQRYIDREGVDELEVAQIYHQNEYVKLESPKRISS